MKWKLLILTVILVLSPQIILAQTQKQIREIRAEVKAIDNSAAKYTKKTKNVEDISLEGTEATYYVSGKGLKKIVAKMYGETYNATGEFYFSGEELIFVFVRFNRYKGGLSTPIASREEQRFYFSDGNLIRLLVGKKELKSNEERYAELKDEIIAISGKLRQSFEN